ncbi:MAG: DMT family transporter [Bryobacterales bacterium]|nr:DMT family transporter [Bryobacterales bacterium]MEB2362081.1 DMT family transporter [Bryobacterales bacterium]
MPKPSKSAFALLLLIQLIWGSSWVAIKSAQQQMGPVVLNLWSLGISVLTLYPFVHLQLRSKSKRRSLYEYFDFAMMGIAGVAGMALLYAWGASQTLAANGALISTAVPVLTAVLAAAVLGERLTYIRVVSLAIALTGVFTLSIADWSNADFSRRHLAPNVMLLGGTVSNALYVVYSKKLLASTEPVLLLFLGQLLGFLGAAPFLYFEDFTPAAVAGYTLTTWLSLAFLGVVFYALTMIVFFRLLVYLDAGQIMVATYLQPVLGVLVAAIVLREKITLAMIGSGLLVLGATVLATYGESWRLKPDPLPGIGDGSAE